ncbi:oxygen-independent coproporphyrinogen III oxidase [Natronospira bacteriovora]|uniref:Coproporphyrinogen-III oxidase n=1 Tax=Natronospira bacteriovora TaxID=3069753 RepID=A0ABU0W3U5_9GAMM|nr:oxygen-independent coproporphyrinogen III oxidase [Natronospira sp. AB-CW4]MDQ2068689.1 oxygen-independent coproporphyrinogen III oxidase [Natronospira sp. AB-CW4]
MRRVMMFDMDLMRRYDVRGPRYTSYPTALQFSDAFDEAAYREAATASNEEPIPRDLSIYVHLPFCEKACYYCACHRSITQRKDRADAYLTHLATEIHRQSSLFDPDRTLRQLHLGGGTPTYHSLEQLGWLMNSLGQAFQMAPAAEREFSVEIDPRSVSEDDIRGLVAIGFDRMSLGIQDFDPRVQQAVNRIQPVESVRRQVAAVREAGARGLSFDLIYGLPHQNTESFARTLDTVIELAPDRLSIYGYAHMPDRFPVQRLMNEDAMPGAAERLDLFATAVSKLTEAGYEHIGMDHFARPDDPLVRARDQGRLHRNFQGYSTHAECDLIGLGASAIGKIGDSFSQNLADIRTWQQTLEDGRLPIARGLSLSADDRIRQQVIQNIMCNGHLDTRDVARRHHIDFWSYFAATIPMLRQMADDGLLSFDSHGFQVSSAGRFLLRHVAMLFDAYNGPGRSESRFSRVI